MNKAPQARLTVRVLPRAARNYLSRDASGMLRVHLTAPPVEGAANRALVELLADRLRVPKSALAVLRGTRARDKVVCVDGYSSSDIEQRLASSLNPCVDKERHRG